MKSKIWTKILMLAVLGLVLMPSCFAATVLETTDEYKDTGAFIYGSTRFDPTTIMTADLVFNAGINESKVWVALGNKLNDLDPVTPYYYDGATWYKVTSNKVTPVTSTTDTEKIEDNLHIFFVDGKMKTIEVPYDGTVDDGSVTEGVEYDSEAKKFLVPALTFEFEFTSNNAENLGYTNVDTNTKSDSDEVIPAEIVTAYVASANGTTYKDINEAVKAAAAGSTVTILKDFDVPTAITISKKITLDLNGKTITAKNDPNGDGIFMVIDGGDLTITGEGTIDSACQTNDYSMAIWAKGTGKVTIKNGTFTNVGAKDFEDDGVTENNNELIYGSGSATIVIEGGTFIGNTANKTYGAGFTLNLKDADRATASIVVKGGTFTGFNPANNAAENAGTNFVAEGYKVVKSGDKYTVVAYDASNVTEEAELRAMIANGGTVKLGANIELAEKSIGISGEAVVLDLNGYTISVSENYTSNNVIWTSSTLTVKDSSNGNGTIDTRVTDSLYCIALYAFNGGKITIEDGNYIGIPDAEDWHETVYVQGNGSQVIINGGNFVGDETFTLNLRDSDREVASIVVKGGTFTGFNPANNAAENAGTNFVADGYKVVKSGDKYTVVAYDASNVTEEAELRAMIANGGTVKLGANMDLSTAIKIDTKVTLDLNGKTITAKNDPNGDGIFMVVDGGDLTITGEGTIDSACQTNDYSMAIWAKGTGKVTIKNGTFTNVGAKDFEDNGEENNNELIYGSGSATIVIEGGTFIGNTENETYGAGFTLNLKDADRATASIVVKGGTFTGFDPANNLAEGAGTNFVAEGYKSVANGNTFVVSAE